MTPAKYSRCTFRFAHHECTNTAVHDTTKCDAFIYGPQSDHVQLRSLFKGVASKTESTGGSREGNGSGKRGGKGGKGGRKKGGRASSSKRRKRRQ